MEKIKFILSVCFRIKDKNNEKMGKDIITHGILPNKFLSHWNFNDQRFVVFIYLLSGFFFRSG
jgi:hypothetical protein